MRGPLGISRAAGSPVGTENETQVPLSRRTPVVWGLLAMLYLIDKHGNIRYAHIGEGKYDTTERLIGQSLAEPN